MEAVYDKIGKMDLAAKLAIWLGVQAIIGLVYFFGFYKDISDQKGQLERAISEENNNLKAAESRYKEYKSIKARVQKLQDLNKRLARSLPEESLIPLGEIHKRAEASGVQLAAITRQEEEMTSVYARIPISITVRGTYHSVMDFFWKLGQMDRIVKISNIKIDRPTRRDGEVFVEVSCQAATFRYLAAEDRDRGSGGARRGR